MSFVSGSGDLYGLDQLGKIICPDCLRAYLTKLKKDPNMLVCSNCGLLISETDLAQEQTIVPQSDMGISVNDKPYFNQIGANTIYNERDDRPSGFSLDTMTNKEVLQQYTIENLALAKTGGMKISNRRRRKTTYGKEEDTIKVVTKLMSHYGTDVKVELS